MSDHAIICIGASAGGVEAVRDLLANLPADLPAAVFVVIHTSPEGPGLLPDLLNRVSQLPVITAVNNGPVLPGRVYVAPLNRHLIVDRDNVKVQRGPTENNHRPAIDPLFRSAAKAYGPRVIGVILTGFLDDGAAGLAVIKRFRGATVVQDPEEAIAPSMPEAAIAAANPEFIVPMAEMPGVLIRLSETSRSNVLPWTEPREEEVERTGTPSAYVCPDCKGTLWEVADGDALRFHCRVGHNFTAESMMSSHDDAVERALWEALRALDERADLTGRLAAKAKERNHTMAEVRFRQKTEAARQNAEVLRKVLMDGDESQMPVTHDPKLQTGSD
jgi:two-component system chemotaxis response regulator CheB